MLHQRPWILPHTNPQTETVDAELRIGNHRVRFSAQFVNEMIELHELLPLFQSVTDKVVEIAVADASEEGKQISCRSGCGACCSQLVPISKAEAAALRNLVESLPDKRQTEIRSRFNKNLSLLNKTGLLDELEKVALSHDRERLKAIGLAYLELNLPCPFLDNQSCSIHTHRPLSCREFLVVSDPTHCAKPDSSVVESVVLPTRVSPILYRLSSRDPASDMGFLPLVQLLASAESIQTEQPTPAPARDWVNLFIQHLNP
jgi:Fe-S-cluster containining protein